MKKAQKVKVVEELKEKLDKSKSLVLTDYRGLTHKQLEEFKRNLKDLSSEFLVAKNTLLKLALPDSITQSLETSLTGPTAVLFSYNDEVASLPILAKFIKNFGLPKIKAGVFGDKVTTSEDVLRLASLPSRQILSSRLVSNLKSPLYKIVNALNWNIQKLVLILNARAENQN